MKKIILAVLSILVIVNTICVYKIMQVAHSIPVTLQEYRTELAQKLTKVNELLSDVEVVKKAVGWKTTKLSPTDCLRPESLREGAFSVVTTDETTCYVHDFARLNELVKQAGMYFLNGQFGSFMHTIEPIMQLPKEDLKAKAKKLLKELQE